MAVTIDERLEKLTERHEALTQTVEIVTGMQKQNEKTFAQLAQQIEKLVSVVEGLAEVARGHDGRIRRLEQE